MTAAELLRALHSAGVELEAAGDRLRYSAPAGVMTDALKREIREHKLALLAMLDAADDIAVPLTPAQQSFWLLEQLNPGSKASGEQFVMLLHGALDADALRAAWHALLDRHPVLRIRLETADGEIRQRPVAPGADSFAIVAENPGRGETSQDLLARIADGRACPRF